MSEPRTPLTEELTEAAATVSLVPRSAVLFIFVTVLLDMIGLGRPMCVETDAPNKLLAGAESCGTWEKEIRPAKAGMGWFALALISHGDGQDPNTAMTGEEAMKAYVANEEATASALVGR